MIDLMLNYRQSGHPGGSRSKVHVAAVDAALGRDALGRAAPVAPLRRPLRALGRPHRARSSTPRSPCSTRRCACGTSATGDARFAFPDDGKYALTWEDLLQLRRHGGLPGHAEMEGKTLFLKFNTGPSGHGMPPAAGEALRAQARRRGRGQGLRDRGRGRADDRARATRPRTRPGASASTTSSSWSTGTTSASTTTRSPRSSTARPTDWFAPYGWRVVGHASRASEWGPVTRARARGARAARTPSACPPCAWVKTRKGRGYWQVRQQVARHAAQDEQRDVLDDAQAVHGEVRRRVRGRRTSRRPPSAAALRAQVERATSQRRARRARSATRRCVDYLSRPPASSSRDEVPDRAADASASAARRAGIFDDERLYDFRSYPAAMWAKPGDKQPNRAALATWGAWVNTLRAARSTAGRCSSPARPTSPSRRTSPASPRTSAASRAGAGTSATRTREGALLPQQITEFTNAGHHRRASPRSTSPTTRCATFDGFWAACSTYGSFSLPQVRADAPVQPARAGLRAEGRQGALGRRPLRARDGRGLAHALRHLRARA